eukprot:61324-Prymnesium_polylepis.1
MAQTWLALQSATTQLRTLCGRAGHEPSASLDATLQAALRKMWSDTGDALAVQYTGFSNLTSVSKSGPEDADRRKSLVQVHPPPCRSPPPVRVQPRRLPPHRA